jgi:hypothetical protein
MEYDHERQWEAQVDMTRDPLEDQVGDLTDNEPEQWLGDRRAGAFGSAEPEEADADYEEWLTMDFYFDGYSRSEARSMARDQLKRERSWRRKHPDN